MPSLLRAVFTAAALSLPIANAGRVGHVGGGRVKIFNNCKSDVKITLCYDGGNLAQGTVKQDLGPPEGTPYILKAGTSSYEQEWYALNSGAISIKMHDLDDSQKCPGWEVPHFQFEYSVNVDSNILNYDASSVNGNPWAGNWMLRTSDNAVCNWEEGHSYQCSQDDVAMRTCSRTAVDIDLLLCSNDRDTHFLGKLRPKCACKALDCIRSDPATFPPGYKFGIDYGYGGQWPDASSGGYVPPQEQGNGGNGGASNSTFAPAPAPPPPSSSTTFATVSTPPPSPTPTTTGIMTEVVVETVAVTVTVTDGPYKVRRHLHGHHAH